MDEKEQALIKRFATVVGHELRNPLAVINNSAYFLKAKVGAGADAKVAKHLDILASEVNRANELINEIVSYARPSEPAVVPIDLASIAETAAKAVANPGQAKLKLDFPKKGFEAKADPQLVADALKRLVLNALEAAADGGTVTVTGSVEGKDCVVEVKDTGKGFSADALAMAGAPFFSTKPKNLGLGLAKAQQTAERQKGSLKVESSAKGGLVTLRLPKA
jgi:signal transduction histidine kinase